MSNEADITTANPGLVKSANNAFVTLLLVGIGLLAIAFIAWVVGITGDDYGEVSAKVISYSIAGAAIQMTPFFLVGAGIIAGLGRREND